MTEAEKQILACKRLSLVCGYDAIESVIERIERMNARVHQVHCEIVGKLARIYYFKPALEVFC